MATNRLKFLKQFALNTYAKSKSIDIADGYVNPENSEKRAIRLIDNQGEVSWIRASKNLDVTKPMLLCLVEDETGSQWPLVTNSATNENFTHIEL